MDFVDKALQGHDSPITKFSLKCDFGVDPVLVECWICNAVQRGVTDLEFVFHFPIDADNLEEGFFLPPGLFKSSTLVHLKIWCELGVDMGYPGAYLPLLKTLKIDSGWISISDELERFLASFPVLEELYMVDVEWPDADQTLLSASLRKLTIHATGCEDFQYPNRFSFDAPNLLYLQYTDSTVADYPQVNLTNLVEALIDLKISDYQAELIRAPDDDEDEDGYLLCFRNFWKLIGGIRNVEKLFLSADTLQVLSLCCESMPMFNIVNSLRIKSDEDRRWEAMPVLLRKCAQLETLFLEGLLHFVTDKYGDACDCILREDSGHSLLSCPVKKLQITGFQGTTREKEMIWHFLKSFPNLKEVVIYVAEEDDPTNVKAHKILKIIAKMVHEEDRGCGTVAYALCATWEYVPDLEGLPIIML